MKKLLMFLVLLTVSVGTWAYTGSGTNISLSEQGSDKQIIATAQAGALSTWFNSLTNEQKSNFANENTLTNLVITGPMNEADFTVLSWSKVTTVDLSKVIVTDVSHIGKMDLANAETIILPNGLTKEQIVSINEELFNETTNKPQVVAGITGEVVITPVNCFIVPGSTTEEQVFTGEVPEGSSTVTVSDYSIWKNLNNANGYPEYTYQNTLVNWAQFTTTIGSVNNNQISLSEFAVPVNTNTTPFSYTNPITNETVNLDANVTTNDLGYINGAYYKIIDFSPDTYSFPIHSTKYLYTYVDLEGNTVTINGNGNQTTEPSQNPDADGKIELKYTGELSIYTKDVSEFIVDGMVAYVNTAGSLSSVASTIHDSDVLTQYQGAENVTIMGNINVSDVQTVQTDYPASTFVDFADATGVSAADIATNLFPNNSPSPISCVMPNGTDLSTIDWKSTQNNLYAFTDNTKTELNISARDANDRSDINEAFSIVTADTKSIKYSTSSSPSNISAAEITALDSYTTIENLDLSGVDGISTTVPDDLTALDNSNLKYITLPTITNGKALSDYTVSSNIKVLSAYETSTNASIPPTAQILVKEAGNLSGAIPYFSSNVSNCPKWTVSGDVNGTDMSALNSNTTVTSLDLKGADLTPEELSSLNMSELKYLRLPSTFDTISSMSGLKDNSKNPKLEVAVSTNEVGASATSIMVQSFVPNGFGNSIGDLTLTDEVANVRSVTMTGYYGDQDLKDIFSAKAGVWDFTGANFANCTIDAVDATYYNYDDPFCDGPLVAPSTTTNGFYYFNQYAPNVVDIKLPDNNMTHLPMLSLEKLASNNKDNYIAIYGQEAFDANKETDAAQYIPLETLVIPNCYTDLDQECGKWAHIRHLVVGSNTKRIHGGAFLNCIELEDLDFAAGLSDCYVGDRSFNECRSMKHIALSEGIVSLGYGAFWNSQHLESIRLPQSLINIGNNAFDNCLALSSITIPENVEKIGKMAFRLCPFTDIYLTTTDPEKIPLVWSAGNDFNAFDGNCSFNHGHIDGWEGGVDAYEAQIDNVMTWDEAAEFYFLNWNGLPVLHFPAELAEKVRSYISSQYAMKTKADEDGNQYGLPKRVDMDRRDNIPGADLGTQGRGKYTSDGWAQFLMMKEYVPNKDIVYSKEYEDVWYTMCFPFDLTDEQLASAFNETFNIVDFSGVEVTEETATDPLTLTLHFNTVAQTTYKDNEGNVYTRKTDNDGTIVREQHGNYKYNVYIDGNGNEYHHVDANPKLVGNKTKTFAQGSSLEAAAQNIANAIIIDGILASAGHPYMIHPAIGTSNGNPRNCYFSGISWIKEENLPTLYENEKREIDLGVELGDLVNMKPSPENYLQARYEAYSGEKYSFIGNYKLYGEIPANNPQPTVENHLLQELPLVTAYTSLYPYGPEMPASLQEIYSAVGPKMTEAPTVQTNPEDDSEYADVKDLLMADRVSWTDQGQTYSSKYYEDLAQYEIDEFFTHYDNWGYKTQSEQHRNNNLIENGLNAFKAYFNDVFVNNDYSISPESEFAELKGIATQFAVDMNKYLQYLEDYQAYQANVTAWNTFEGDPTKRQEKADYESALSTYRTQVANWKSACASVTATNNLTIQQWENEMKPYRRLIPTGAYFLGRKKNPDNSYQMPRYFREIADDQRPVDQRTGGFWSQYSAVIIPNETALNGIEKKLGPGIANNTKGLNMVFDEGFMGEFNPTEIKEIIAEAEEKGEKVQHMNIVYSINGQVMGRDTQSLSNLPQGMYIINGKKYLVK